mmetsp:Transcript_30800/g.94424  ORF Transcript_30800/g.94424 Transcript_30800/m.94424 type:complete len:328 (+) Transcript_30800:14-997(+)
MAAAPPPNGAPPPPPRAVIEGPSQEASSTLEPFSRQRICWGSFERNTGQWCPFSEQDEIEAAFQAGEKSIFLPNCFNATVHFTRPHFFQTTPGFGTKPPGYRSVLRGEVGSIVRLHYWNNSKAFRVDPPTNELLSYVMDIKIEAAAEPAATVWQWLDLLPAQLPNATEANWHAFAPDHSQLIENASIRGEPATVVVGLSQYTIQDFDGSYATQVNTRTNGKRIVRRATNATGIIEPPTPADLAEEACGLCTERFQETPHWPVHRTPCQHAFHYSCIQHVLCMDSDAARKCPLCRAPLERSDSNRNSAIFSSSYSQRNPSSFSGTLVG